jgi:hypothetical protein
MNDLDERRERDGWTRHQPMTKEEKLEEIRKMRERLSAEKETRRD